jgi:hypothetical protein
MTVHSSPTADLISLISQPWPSEIKPDAFHGLAGELVELIEPHSEADPVALLASFLVGFGNLVGDSAHFVAEADRHPCRLFATLVGETSKGRKGTSWGHIRNCLRAIDPEWNSLGGLSSGEGLIWAVRDPTEKQEPMKEKGESVSYQAVKADPGVVDKRLMVVEGEFARVLRVMGKEQNTLSPVLRIAWDSGNLEILNKNTPAKATGAHVSLLCHITKEELTNRLGDTDIFNGFANRFLWFCVRRSKLLPEGGSLQPEDRLFIQERIREAVAFAREVGEIKKSESARELWAEVYPELSDGRSGLLGGVTNRAEAQVMRVSCIYALLDRSREVKREHLVAALSLWDYSFRSCQYIFDDKAAHKDTRKLLDKLDEVGPGGLTRTEIQSLFQRHKSKAEVDNMLNSLLEAGIAIPSTVETNGRSTEIWSLLRPAK